MKKNISIFFLLISSLAAWSQQYPLFTNYVLNDFGFNPAIAGSTPYWDTRLTYRQQWAGIDEAPQTQIASIQGPTKTIGFGGYFFNDTAGKIRRTGFSLAASYGFELGDFGKIGLGVSGGYYNVRLKSSDNLLGSTDPLFAQGASGMKVPEVSAGIYLQMKNGAFVGISMPHLLRKELTFSNQETLGRDLQPHYYGMAGYRKRLNDMLEVEPSVLVKFTENAPIQFDGALRVIYNDKFWLGGSYRHAAAATAMAGYEINRAMTIAYAYDLTLSDLRVMSGGSHEFSFGYKFGFPKDNDGDGMVNREDDCPDEPGSKELHGCPEKAPVVEVPSDRDRDGVIDRNDRCPDIPGLKEAYGCPFSDRDKDGVADEKDRCPDIPGAVKKEGCPIEDLDGDTVADEEDRCPKTPGAIENEGCPQASAAETAILNLAAKSLFFDMGKDVLQKESYRFLDKLAELLIQRPDYKISIAGHADSVGKDEFNFNLSKRRSNAVSYYLINRGVGRERLIQEYYGETKPLASNVNEDTRWKNRRVTLEFVWE